MANRFAPAPTLLIALALAFGLLPVQPATVLITVGALDATSPSAPFELGTVSETEAALGVETADGIRYTAGYDGMQITDLGPEYEPAAVPALSLWGRALLFILPADAARCRRAMPFWLASSSAVRNPVG